MRIKQLELIGFKSFVHRTVLDFPPGITAIVGPNGCGKSNVVDAIRWVLGEQSPKHLRGDSMEAVIFNGNERVPAAGMAQVSLTFVNDGPDRSLPVPELDVSSVPAHFRNLSEIMVTRRYHRSGESEYFINKTPCRLKDITELFLGTGVGSKAYAIIEQGRVEQLINAKPEERRLFIEEAAGTTLYRSRKLAAERKMERTRENLLRVNDVLREIDRQIQYLKRMAKRAEQYRELQAQVRDLDLALAGAQWRRLAASVAELEAELGRERDAEQVLIADLGRLETERGEKVSAQATADEALARRREVAAALDAECKSLRERLVLLSQEVDERARRLGRLEADLESTQAQRLQLEETISERTSERARDLDLLESDEGELTCREAEMVAMRAAVHEAAATVEEAQNAVVAQLTREAACRSALADQERRQDDVSRRLTKLEKDQVEARERLSALDASLMERRSEAAALRERLHAAEGDKERCAEHVRVLAEERRAWERAGTEARDRLVQLRSRLEALHLLQRNYEGYQHGVRTVLLDENRAEGVLGVVADVIGAPQQHERALAAALGERLQYVIVAGEEVGRGAVAKLRDHDSGRGSFIPLAPRRVPLNGSGVGLNGNTRRLLDLVQVEAPYEQIAETLLGDVVLVPDLDTGLKLWRQNGVHVTMVTPEGDVIDATGVITGGNLQTADADLVSRRRVAAELLGAVRDAEAQAREAQERLTRAEDEVGRQGERLQGLDKDVHGFTLELLSAEKDIERLEGERQRWMDRIEVARFETAAAATEQAEGATRSAGIRGELAAAEQQRQTCEEGLRSAHQDAEGLKVQLEQLSDALTQARVRVAERRQQVEAAGAVLVRLQGQVAEVVTRAGALVVELEQTRAEHAALEESVRRTEEKRVSQEAHRELAEGQIATARADAEQLGAALAIVEQRLRDSRVQLEAVRSRCVEAEMNAREQRLRAEHLAAAMRERYGLVDLAAEGGAHVSDEDAEALARLDALRERLARLGDVNVTAIDELRELEERAQFLRSQKEDLERSLSDLERTIQRLNRASRARLAETFAAANEKFQAVLPRLFRGGEARLVLTDEHNVLEAGVDIVVRPPGKRLDTVTLLSGGEKALVAVSLIFSLFLINPTPFCFLDEVDAPLDDANIGRFTELVRDVSQHSQFIVITHNKRTMQAADVLYGVTMEDPGISKVISVAMH
jgi:chromosome segregation protein